jgi:hypothetical protein
MERMVIGLRFRDEKIDSGIGFGKGWDDLLSCPLSGLLIFLLFLRKALALS